MQILLVEDDKPMLSLLSESFRTQHYTVSTAADGQTGLELAQQFAYDLIILDIVLPKLDGISLCRQLRTQGCQTPILLLTAKESATDRILGLDAGADDYVIKPFNLEELLARVRALLRRGKSVTDSVMTWQNLRFDGGNQTVTAGDQLLHLTPKEYGLLELFLLNPKRVFSRSALLDRLWDFAGSSGEETVSTHIKCLRQKLKAAGVADPIETVHGMGYRLRPPVETPTETEAKIPAEQPQVKNHRPDQRRKVIATTERVWRQSQQQFINQVQQIEQAANALLLGALTPELQKQAKHAAHKLAGSLGIFGLAEGSQLAKALEDRLQSQVSLDAMQAEQLLAWVQRLYQELHSKSTAEPPPLPLVLIVDDDSLLTKQIQQEAQTWNLKIETATNLETARTLINQTSPAVIVLDLNFPDHETGLALLQELKQQLPHIPVVAFTAQGSLQERLAVSQLGCVFLQKPLPVHAILSTIHDVLRQQCSSADRVMIVDDDKTIIARLSLLLQPLGITVTGVSDPQQFWQVLQATAPSLLILDLEMPNYDGFQLCQVVRCDPHWQDLPIIFLSNHTETNQINHAFAVGADDYLNKTDSAEALVNCIVRRLKRASSQSSAVLKSQFKVL